VGELSCLLRCVITTIRSLANLCESPTGQRQTHLRRSALLIPGAVQRDTQVMLTARRRIFRILFTTCETRVCLIAFVPDAVTFWMQSGTTWSSTRQRGACLWGNAAASRCQAVRATTYLLGGFNYAHDHIGCAQAHMSQITQAITATFVLDTHSEPNFYSGFA
jgi:hypothetical protein